MKLTTTLALLLLVSMAPGLRAAGSDCWGLSGNWNCLDRFQLQAEAASGNTFVVNNTSGTAKFTVDNAGATTLAGATTISGAATFSSTIDLGSSVPSLVTSRTAWIMASSITTGSFTGIFELKNTKTTIQFADASADDHVYVVWPLPDDFAQATSGVAVKVAYMCDDATVTAGEWDVKYLAITPDTDADAALGNELTVVDTPVQNQWMLTGAMVIPPSAIVAADTLLSLDVYHDVSDPLCNGSVVNLLGIQLGYTTDKNY